MVGHCGPDTSYLILAAKKAVKDVAVDRINDEQSLQKFLTSDGGLILVNRVLDGDFPDEDGISLIGRIIDSNPGVKAMLVSNYEDSQADAVKRGAMVGFGKREIGSARVEQLLKAAF